MAENDVVSEIRKDYIASLVSSGRRLDGRGLDEIREVKVDRDVVGQAEGSARVEIGRTKVIVGVKVDLGKPYPDHPDKGVLTTNAELNPMASPTFDLMQPNTKAIELARVVDRGIRESGCIDLGKLCIEPGEKAWVVYVDIHVLDYDGNLFDASGIGAVAALRRTVVKAREKGVGEDFELPVRSVPIPVTSVKIGGSMLVDPGVDEETIADARITVTTDEEGHVRAMQKGLGGSLTMDDVRQTVKLSQDIGKVLRPQVE